MVAIVLAAGAGRRFGGGKLTAPWRGGVLLDGALAAAFAAPVGRVVVVLGADLSAEAAARTFAEARAESHRLAFAAADDWNEGLSASLRAGVAAAGSAAGALVFLGDMPRIPDGLPGRLVEAFRDGDAAVAPERDGVLGHPVLIGATLFAQCGRLRGDRGARALLEGLGSRLRRVKVEDAGVLFDIDTREALLGPGLDSSQDREQG